MFLRDYSVKHVVPFTDKPVMYEFDINIGIEDIEDAIKRLENNKLPRLDILKA